MTLTTERQQFEQWWETAMHNGYPPRFGWEHWRDGDGYRDDDGEFQGLWQAWVAGREALANREAQPVALNGWRVTVTRTGDRQGVASISGPGVFRMEVPVEYSMLDFMEALTAPPAPQSTNAADWGINMQTGTPILVYKNCSVIESEQAHYVLSLINGAALAATTVHDGWIACSERMPEPNKYVQVSDGVWVGIGMYNDADHFEDDERWQDEHHEFIDLLHHPVTHWMPLPAAPEGGNG
ncbi:DUF551 domain-containing protein [Serratia marcescens]|uniref:DUF551 domain-containing protein n=1 Tax=Serratia marcescens TaxID=615 RepID=UPI0036F947E0